MLRHQLNVLRRSLHGRVPLTNHDRLFFIQLYRWFPSILEVLTIIRPETLLRWHSSSKAVWNDMSSFATLILHEAVRFRRQRPCEGQFLAASRVQG